MISKAIGIIFIGITLTAIVAGVSSGCGKKNHFIDGVNNMTPTTLKLPPIDTVAPVKTETATFALGWFWGSDSRFGSLEGVIRTRVGYAGGTTNYPTYYNIGDHSETVQIDYDPTQISYEKLLEVFWNSHNPATQQWSKQYMSIIFYHSEEQKSLALTSMQREETRSGQKYFTEVMPFSEFFFAEDYHQKYYLQQVSDLFNEFEAMYPEISQLIRSTAVARVNGYIGGYGSYESLQEQLNSFGLSPTGNEKVLQIGSRLLSDINWNINHFIGKLVISNALSVIFLTSNDCS
jgi:peptide-methionine (S)-S-oxide reductase